MDIKTLLEEIRATKEKLNSANRIIEVFNADKARKIGIYTETHSGNDLYLCVSKEPIYNLAVSQKEILETQLAVLEDAKNTAERVIAGLLPDSKTSA